jgi:hypothetical protein
MAGAEGAAEKAVAKGAEHVIAKAVEKAGVRDAEKIAAKDAARAADRTVGKDVARGELSAADRAALREYTGPAYRDINNYLRGGRVTEEEAADLAKRSDAISSALGKLPPHEGTVFRGGNFDEDVLARYRPGEVVREDAFTSSSTKRGFRGNTQFEIESSNGKYIAPYAEPRFQHQEEVLFDRGTQFRVLAKDVRNGKTFIIMREVQ